MTVDRRMLALPRRFFADLSAATAAGSLSAPFVLAVDKAIAQSAAGGTHLWSSLFGSSRALLSSPWAYLRQPAMLYMWALYSGTYAVANLFCTFEELHNTHCPLAKTITIFSANTTLGLWKDSAYARMFGKQQIGSVSFRSLASWWARDLIAIGCIFVGPPVVADELHQRFEVSRQQAEVIAQLAIPLMLQPIVAPLALYGYVAYNYAADPWQTQLAIVRHKCLSTIAVRMVRIFPPYCLGGVLNRSLRQAVKLANA